MVACHAPKVPATVPRYYTSAKKETIFDRFRMHSVISQLRDWLLPNFLRRSEVVRVYYERTFFKTAVESCKSVVGGKSAFRRLFAFGCEICIDINCLVLKLNQRPYKYEIKEFK
ncbi:MAG TPA: hypothetical protein DCQ12_02555 [Candidatus Cloacimonas sp.]|nr:hypothetical protein [Candidatus Cloacimonas sp.]